MNHLSTLDSSASISHVMHEGEPLFTGDTRDEVGLRWGALFAVFGPTLQQIAAEMSVSVIGGVDLIDQLSCSSRRYSALLERMCMADAKSAAHALVLDVAENFTVILMNGGPYDQEAVDELQAQFDANQPDIPEDVFIAALSKALDMVFASIQEKGRYIEVQIGNAFYVFTRTVDRDDVLREMGVGTNAGTF